MHQIDLETWKRREHFQFFRGYEQPFWNVTAEVDVTALLERCRQPGGPSFFLAALYLSLKAANAVEELRLRLCGDGVVLHDVLHGGSTVLRPDETFTFAYFDFAPDFPSFAETASAVLAAAREKAGGLEPRPDRDDLIHYSVLPWISFTSFAHARRRDPDDSVPKIVFGRYHERAGTQKLPVSVEVHHALVDGLHIGRFFKGFKRLLDELPLGASPETTRKGGGAGRMIV